MNISTAVSAIGSTLKAVGQTAFAALPVFAPLIASAVAPRQRTGGSVGNVRTSQYGLTSGFMPGGGQMIPVGMGSPMVGGGGVLDRAMEYVTPTSQPMGSVGCITAYQAPGRYMLPRTVNVPHPTIPNQIETYVRAPRVKYRVSVSRAGKRRCSGGH